MSKHDAALFTSDTSGAPAPLEPRPPLRQRHDLRAGQIFELLLDGTIVGSLEIRRNSSGKYGLWTCRHDVMLRLRLATET